MNIIQFISNKLNDSLRGEKITDKINNKIKNTKSMIKSHIWNDRKKGDNRQISNICEICMPYLTSERLYTLYSHVNNMASNTWFSAGTIEWIIMQYVIQYDLQYYAHWVGIFLVAHCPNERRDCSCVRWFWFNLFVRHWHQFWSGCNSMILWNFHWNPWVINSWTKRKPSSFW